MVLCHGWPELAYSWRHQIPALAAAGYRVLAPRISAGYGRSSRPGEVAAYDIVHLTGDLTGLLDHYGYDNALFVGHDWGAIVVWALAMLYPGRTAGVINLSVPFLDRRLPGVGRIVGGEARRRFLHRALQSAGRGPPTPCSRQTWTRFLDNL